MKIARETVAYIIDAFEDFLDEKGIVIENPERDNDDPENAANIYGDDFDDLMNNIIEILGNVGVEVPDTYEEPEKTDIVEYSGVFRDRTLAYLDDELNYHINESGCAEEYHDEILAQIELLWKLGEEAEARMFMRGYGNYLKELALEDPEKKKEVKKLKKELKALKEALKSS